jgi:hypothetical protein
MAQLFRPQANTRFRLGIVLVVVALGGAFAAVFIYNRSDRAWHVGETVVQPIPFRHDLHAGGLGIACRYCHSSVGRSSFAGMPSAHTCMTCHSQVWKGATVLEPLRTSLALNQPIVWNSVHRFPPHAYFHHGIHVSKGVACETCHGDVRTMAQTKKVRTMSMGWCLECHRNPAPYLRPRETARAGGTTEDAERHDIAIARLTSCSTCHR